MAIATGETLHGADDRDPADARALTVSAPAEPRLEDVLDESLAHLARRLVETEGVTPTLADVLDRAVVAVPCGWAAAAVMDEIRDRPARLSASTDEPLAAVIARIAADAGTSPGIVAFTAGELVHAPDLIREGRFGSYPARLVEETPIRSVLSLPLCLRGETLGVLTLYAADADAFDAGAVQRAKELADLAAVAVDASITHERAGNLEQALGNSRTIGLAIGVLVERHRLTPEQAFQQLSDVSQKANRKLADLARDLAESGEFPPAEP